MEFFGRIRERMERSLQVASETGKIVASGHVNEIVEFIERMIFCNVKTIRIIFENDSHIRLAGSNQHNKVAHKDLFFEYDYFENKTDEQKEAFRRAYCEELKTQLPEIEWKEPKNGVGVIALIERDSILNPERAGK